MRRRPLSIHTSYDADGNRIAKFQSTTGALDGTATDITIYKWNEKNQMTAVDQYATYADYVAGTDSSEIDYGYDAFGNMVSRSPSGISDSLEFYVYDGANVALILNAYGGVIQRELDGAADQVFATEASGGGTNWLLTDNQGTVRDVVQYWSGGSGGGYSGGSGGYVVDHLVYDSFGQMTSQTNSLYQPTVMYAGMQYDADAKMYYDHARWYDAVDAVFASTDPLGFGGRQTNLEEYCGDSPTNFTDPSGMQPPPLSSCGSPIPLSAGPGGLSFADAYQWGVDHYPGGTSNPGFWHAVATVMCPSGGGTPVYVPLPDDDDPDPERNPPNSY
jgi:RHS repeat-associated protein